MDLLNLVARVSLDSSEYENGLSGLSGKVKKFSKVGAAAFGAFMEVGRRATGAVFNTISSGMDGAIQRFDTLNNFGKIMENLGYDASEAKKGINDLAVGIEKLPTTLDAVARQAQQFVPMTKDIGKATDITLAWNNALAAGGTAGADAAGAIVQWTQAMAKGKPDLMEWRRMVTSAPAQMDQLAKAMLGASASQSDLWDKIKDGTVSIDEVNDTMVKMTGTVDEVTGEIQEKVEINGQTFTTFAKQAESASAGIQMSMININAAVSRNLANVMKAFDKALGGNGEGGGSGIAKNMQDLVPVIDSIGATVQGMLTKDISFEEGMTSLIKGFGKGLREATLSGGDLIANLATGMASAAPTLVEQAFIVVRNFRNAIAEKLPDLMTAGAELAGGIAEGLIEGIPRAVDGFTSILSSLTTIIQENGESFISNGLDIVLRLSETIRSGAGQLVDSGLALVLSIAQGIANSLPAIIEKVPQIVTNIAGVINDNAPKILAAGLQIIVALGQGLIMAIPTLIANIPQIIAAIWNALTAFNWLALGRQLVTAIGEGIVSMGESLPQTLRDVASKAWEALRNVEWRSLGSTIIRFVASGVSGLASLVPNALKAIASAAMRMFTGIAWGNVGRDVITAIARGITAALSVIQTAVRGVIEKIKSYFPFNIGSIFKGKVNLPSVSVNKKDGGGASTSMSMQTRDFAKAMSNPYLFTERTAFMAGEAGDELLYGRKALMADIAEATGEGVKTANIYNTIYVNGAEDPEVWAERLVRQMQSEMRMA